MIDDRASVYHPVCERMAEYEPVLIDPEGSRRAAVAMMLRPADSGVEMFFIQRAAHPSDPWSGQIAFPGGSYEVEDGDVFTTACRETREEVGLGLTSSMMIGCLDDQKTSNRHKGTALVISCFVFYCPDLGLPEHNYEVSDSFWVPLSDLTDNSNAYWHQTNYRPEPFRAIRFRSGQVLWGLTYRFVSRFLTIIS